MKLSTPFALLILLAAACILHAGDWPQWRADANRTAAVADELPPGLEIQWVREYPVPDMAWQDPVNRDRMPYDRVYEPVVIGQTLFFGSSISGRITALNTRTGKEEWRFYTGGPVRFAPAVMNGKVYAVSDDGYLYCLAADTGKEIWSFRSGPDARKVLGSGKLVSAWPARGGPVAQNGTVYFGSSIWPFMGVFVYALNGDTGKVKWVNSGSGSIFMNQPHGGSTSFGGIAPQGALALAGDTLIVPNGRAIPAGLDAADGKLKYFYLSGTPYLNADGGPSMKMQGASQVASVGNFYFNFRGLALHMYDVKTGKAYYYWKGNHYPVLTDDTVFLSGNPVEAYDLGSLKTEPYETTVKNKKTGKRDKVTRKRWRITRRWEKSVDGSTALIKAGNRLYAGGKDSITALQLDGNAVPAEAWTRKVTGTVGRLIAADDRLFAVTQEGRIYALGAEKGAGEPIKETVTAVPGEISYPEELLARTGYCLVMGIKDGSRIKGLLDRTKMYVIGVHPEPAVVNTLRNELDKAGLYGKRVSLHIADPLEFRAPQYMASLIVFEDLQAAGAKSGERFFKTVFRSLRPYGGAACFKLKSAQVAQGLEKMIRALGLPKAGLEVSGDFLILTRKGALPDAADWTHLYGDIANSAKSDDKLVKLPLGLLWFGGNSHHDILPRHGHGPSEQVIGGRLFIEGINMLSARDVYTGQVLWKRTFDDLGMFGIYYDKSYKENPLDTSYNQGHIAGANARGTNYIATADAIYLIKGAECLVLDPATGATTKKFPVPGGPGKDAKRAWGYIGVYENLLIGGAHIIPYTEQYKPKKTGRWDNFDNTSSRKLFVLDRHTGTLLWERTAEQGFRHNTVCAGEGKLFAIDRMPAPVYEALQRRGETPDAKKRLLALNIKTGEPVWQKDEGVFGTWLSYSRKNGLLVQCGRSSGDQIKDESSNRMMVLKAKDGNVVWDKPLSHAGPVMLHGDTIYFSAAWTSGKAANMLTGEPLARFNKMTGKEAPWTYRRYYGCNSVIASEYLLTFRSGAAGFYDLARDGGTGNLGGFKSGCTSNLVAANGVLNAPDYTRTCTCSYPNQSSLALVHMPDLEYWTFVDFSTGGVPLKKIGINLGAPGSRTADNGVLWLNKPVGNLKAPDITFTTQPESPEYFRYYASTIAKGDLPWVAASGAAGLSKASLELGQASDMIIDRGVDWQYLAGRHAAEGWNKPGFKAKDWKTGKAGFGYGDGDDTTVLGDMRNSYTTVYIRKEFDGTGLKDSSEASLVINYDDGFIAYLNGQEIARAKVKRGSGAEARGVDGHEAGKFEIFRIKDFKKLIKEGKNVLALEGHNAGRGSSDFTLDPYFSVSKAGGRIFTVRLVFAEFDPEKTGTFDVLLQGKTVLKDFNPLKEAGGAAKSVVKEFKGIKVGRLLEVELKPAGVLCGVEVVEEP